MNTVLMSFFPILRGVVTLEEAMKNENAKERASANRYTEHL